ncbi:hypothetical protein BM529_03625, partial [Clostridioides difficile]
GAVTTGALVSILESEDLKDLREALKLDENSKVLLISTEGDTVKEVMLTNGFVGEADAMSIAPVVAKIKEL